jgi:hypothetical protein
MESKPQKIIWNQAPCRPDGEISSDGQEESKEGTCRCPANPVRGCCVDAIGVLLPRTLRPDSPLSLQNPT